MYFLVIMAFALVLSDALPPDRLNLLSAAPVTQGTSLIGTLAVAIGQLPLVFLAAVLARRRSRAKLDGTAEGHDRAADSFVFFQQAALFVLAGLLILTMVFTPWVALVRGGWRLDGIPLLGDLLLLAPFFLSLAIIWSVFYPLEMRLHVESFECFATPAENPSPPAIRASLDSVEPISPARAALSASTRRKPDGNSALGTHLLDKFRHQVLILAIPMSIIVLAKHLIYRHAGVVVTLPRDEAMRGLLLNFSLGTVSVLVLASAPLMLRYIWATEPLPDGALRERFTRTCKRIGLRYREILLWHTHGMAANAAVMGFVGPLRYILVSDALLETMSEEEIEAVFGHEAGHVRHWHLPFFGLFAIISMYLAGGVMHLMLLADREIDPGVQNIDSGVLQLVALAVLLLMWLFGFSGLSRAFERQADLFGVRCIAPDIKICLPRCPIHGDEKAGGLCISAANIFGRTLGKIADLNGIPREAPSWRHGSIESRCRQIESFTRDLPAMRRFDGKILRIKIALVAAVLIGSVIAVWLYYEPVMAAISRLR